MPRSVVLNFWNASIVKIMKLNGLDLEKCELLLSFLGQQTTFYRVFILKERRQLLFKDIKEVLECNDEVANILVEVFFFFCVMYLLKEFFKLPEHPTTYDSVIRDLINALLGSDEDIMFEKAKAFFEVYEDVPGAAEHPELDSREFFSIIANKFKEIDRKDNLKLESVLFDVLLRIVQRGFFFCFVIYFLTIIRGIT
jgi:hypothetical protein